MFYTPFHSHYLVSHIYMTRVLVKHSKWRLNYSCVTYIQFNNFKQKYNKYPCITNAIKHYTNVICRETLLNVIY